MSEGSIEDIPKDDLMALCMKMNKRMQSLESKHSMLYKRSKTLLAERRSLLDLLALHVPGMSVLSAEDSSDVDTQAMADIWSEHNRARQERTEETLRIAVAAAEERGRTSAYADGAPPGEVHDRAAREPSDAQDHESQVSQLTATNAQLSSDLVNATNKVSILEHSLNVKTSRIEELEKEVEATGGVYEEKLMYMQMQLNVSKGRDDARDREVASGKKRVEDLLARATMLETMNSELSAQDTRHKHVIALLESRVSELEPELRRAERMVSELERNSGASVLMKAEQEAMVTGLRRDLKISIEARDSLQRRLAESEGSKERAEALALQVVGLGEQVEALHASVEEKDAVVKRLTLEAQANIAQHAVRTGVQHV